MQGTWSVPAQYSACLRACMRCHWREVSAIRGICRQPSVPEVLGFNSLLFKPAAQYNSNWKCPVLHSVLLWLNSNYGKINPSRLESPVPSTMLSPSLCRHSMADSIGNSCWLGDLVLQAQVWKQIRRNMPHSSLSSRQEYLLNCSFYHLVNPALSK